MIRCLIKALIRKLELTGLLLIKLLLSPMMICKTLNVPRKQSVTKLIGPVTLAFAVPVLAIENPIEEPPKSSKVKSNEIQLRPEDGEAGVQKIAVLGVGGVPVSQTLSEHLSLPPGVGLAVHHVAPDSAAAQAGMRPHDILINFDGSPIGSQNDLKQAVLRNQPGNEVEVEYIQRGDQKIVKVVLGEHVVRQANLIRRRPMNQIDLQSGLDQFQGIDRTRIEQQMQSHINEMKRHLRGHGGMELGIQGLLDMVADDQLIGQSMAIPDVMDQLKRDGNIQNMPQGMQFSSSSTVTKRDEFGSVTMRSKNGNKEITVTDPLGRTIFSGPYQTPEDKAAVPADLVDRITQMDFDTDSGIRLHINPDAVSGLSEKPFPDIE